MLILTDAVLMNGGWVRHTHRLLEQATERPRMKITQDSRNSLGMPLIGFGTYQLSNEEAERSVREAIAAGFRHIDSAEGYNNEQGTGIGIETSGVPRQEIFVTTKLFPGFQGWGAPDKSRVATIDNLKKQL
ncbi:MAG: aldo/keto reductase, partial [Ignavibacteriae bacterium]